MTTQTSLYGTSADGQYGHGYYSAYLDANLAGSIAAHATIVAVFGIKLNMSAAIHSICTITGGFQSVVYQQLGASIVSFTSMGVGLVQKLGFSASVQVRTIVTPSGFLTDFWFNVPCVGGNFNTVSCATPPSLYGIGIDGLYGDGLYSDNSPWLPKQKSTTSWSQVQ